MQEVSIYKITQEELTDVEKSHNVLKIEPTMGGELSAAEYFNFVLPRYNETGKLLSPGELGCTLSHIRIYKQIMERNESAIILEADISPTEKELLAAKKICAITSLDFIHLGWHPFTAYGIYFKGRKITHDTYKINPHANFHGTYAYYLSATAAKMLLDFHSKSIKPADSWAHFFQEYALQPHFCPLIAHPPQRGDIEFQRIRIATHVYALNCRNMFFYFKKWLLRKASMFSLDREIKP